MRLKKLAKEPEYWGTYYGEPIDIALWDGYDKNKVLALVSKRFTHILFDEPDKAILLYEDNRLRFRLQMGDIIIWDVKTHHIFVTNSYQFKQFLDEKALVRGGIQSVNNSTQVPYVNFGF